MAKPTKRRIDGGDDDESTTTSKRVTAPKSASGSSRYTAPTRAATRGPSSKWVPITMFSLWGLGLLVILLNYMSVLPGSDGGNGWYLVGGLVAILVGIMVSTQYR